MMQQVEEYKIVLLGVGGVGKTAYLNRLLDRPFTKKYKPDMEVKITPVVIETSEEKIKFNIWTPPGQLIIPGIKEEVFSGADGVIIMVSDSGLSLKALTEYRQVLIRCCQNIPVIIVFNKCELAETMKLYEKVLRLSVRMMKISCKQNLNIKEPLFELARTLKNRPVV